MSGTSHLRKLGAPLLLVLLLAAGYVIYTRVLFAPQGTAALSWVPPVETEAEEPLTNLAGYNIHCWGDSGRYTNTIRIDDPSITRYIVEGLRPGRYQCAVSAFTDDGFESVLSNVVELSVE